jgi:DNA-binding Xre family transcriptional regulator
MNPRRIEIVQLQETLKEIMRTKRLKLTHLSDHLGISIATAKRLLNHDDLSLERVLDICDWLEIKFEELVDIAKSRKSMYQFCSESQEIFLAKNQGHFAFLKSLQRGLSLGQMQAQFGLSKADVRGYLSDLEMHEFLTLTHDDNVVLLVKDGMDWRPGGALWQAYYKRWIGEVTQHMAEAKAEDPFATVEISQRQFTEETMKKMSAELDELSRKYAAISRLERIANPAEKLHFYTLMCLGHKWSAPVFQVPKYK